MSELQKYIESGILETYVLGLATAEEIAEVERMALIHPEVRKEIEAITETLRSYSKEGILEPNSTIKPMVLAILDYQERIAGGEIPSDVPLLNEKSKSSDYDPWLNRKDMVRPQNSNDVYAKLIGATASVTTAIVWIRSGTPPEVHNHEHERFLIIEGTCDIVIDGKAHSLVKGDYMSIPLHAEHFVKVTSLVPCKVILQRVAA